ncbi:M23 family metallopeptidase [Glutamicibacter sp. JC586]|uniref:M23 family metallopeptidase n=1 Tax=Glutamicibacter sp. JC586 TaxID=2590552 RepID=UPI001359BA9F|nr:M23 family metallopeptidase [Glutamicibacter sp. JC586]
MVETKTAGRRRAADTEIDVITEITASVTQRANGRRASRAASAAPAITPVKPVNADFVGRRFDSIQRYGVAPAQKDLAAKDAQSNVVSLPQRTESQTAPAASVDTDSNVEFIATVKHKDRKSSRAGFSHKIAAVAAVSGLALAVVAPQLSGSTGEEDKAVAAEQRTATSAVIDVKAPASDTEISVERAALSSKVNKKVASEDKFSEIMTASGGDVATIKETAGLLDAPVDSQRITSSFGHRKNPTGAGFMIHSGTDYGVASGTKVYAAADGVVEVAGWAGHSGNRVTLDHGNGLETGYSHNSQVLVKVGDKVKRGDLIALSGTTGNSTGPHVHFEVIVDGQFKDPAGWL